MRKRSSLLALTLALALILGSFQSVFAAAPPTDVTRQAIIDSGVQCIQKIKDEVDAERIAKHLSDEVAEGKYKLIDTATLKAKVDKKADIVIIDTMPAGWWKQRNIPGSINQVVGGGPENGPEFAFQSGEAASLIKQVKAAVGTKTVTKYYNKKTKKWTTKKPAKKYLGKTKKVKEVNKDKMIVVYCGFVGCARSHQAAKYLVSKGFKKVYRYSGGISAWVDANNDIEGTDVTPQE